MGREMVPVGASRCKRASCHLAVLVLIFLRVLEHQALGTGATCGVRLPYDREGKGLHLHGVSEAVNP